MLSDDEAPFPPAEVLRVLDEADREAEELERLDEWQARCDDYLFSRDE